MSQDKMTDLERAKQVSGRIMLCGMISLFLGMLLCLVGIALQFGSQNPAGGTVLTIGQLLLGAWLLLLFAGIAARISLSEDSPEPVKSSDPAPKDESSGA